MALTGNKPRFQHDCDTCQFVGTWFDYDVWLCRSSIIARFSNEPSDYASTNLSHLLHVVAVPEEHPTYYVLAEYKKAWLYALAWLKLTEVTPPIPLYRTPE